MKTISAGDLQSALNADLTWRRREISSLILSARSADAAVERVIVRTAVPLLYAHWEGFGRECISRYLELVSLRRVKFLNLRSSFLYLASISSLGSLSDKPVREGIRAVEELITRQDATNKDSFRKKISTRSNLRFPVLDDLLALCGLESAIFYQYSDFINRELCDARNEVAHGGGAAPPLNLFVSRRDKAFELMSLLQDTVVNAAVLGSYRSL